MNNNKIPLIKFFHFKFEYPSSNSLIGFEGGFSIYKNEFVLISGPSGSGKSTLFNILKGIIPQYIIGKLSGKILIENKNIIEKYPESLKSKILMLFQNPYSQIVTPFVKDELTFTMENYNLSKKEIYKRYLNICKMFNLFPILNNETFNLSGGEIQKIMLASLIAVEPEIILLDEPTAFLDPDSRINFFSFLSKLKGKYTILIIEHNSSEIIDLVDKIIYFHKTGKIELFSKGDYEKLNNVFFNKNFYNKKYFNKIYNNFKYDDNDNIEINKKKSHFFFENIMTQNVLNNNLFKIKIENLSFGYKKRINKNIKIDKRKNSKNKKNLNSIDNQSMKKITKIDDNYFVFKNVNLTVGQETIAIIGKNGSGKTTLLKLISGILKPVSGEIKINRKNIAYLFQNPETHFMFNTVKEEILHNLKTWNKDKITINKLYSEIITFFNFAKYENKNPFLLSEGEKRRLTFAQTVALNRDIILLDEPTFGQDKDNFIKIANLIMQLKLLKKTLIIVTHDIEFAKIVSDKIYKIENKRVIRQEF